MFSVSCFSNTFSYLPDNPSRFYVPRSSSASTQLFANLSSIGELHIRSPVNFYRSSTFMNLQEILDLLTTLTNLPRFNESDCLTKNSLTTTDTPSVDHCGTKKEPTIAIQPPAGKKSMPVTFTQKEIELMPKNFKSYFIENNTVITYRIVKNVYQARYRKNGINIEVASKDFNAMKQKMLERLNDTFTRNSSASTKTIPLCHLPRRSSCGRKNISHL